MDGNDCRGMYDPVRDEIEVSEDRGEVNASKKVTCFVNFTRKCFSAISGDLQELFLAKKIWTHLHAEKSW